MEGFGARLAQLLRKSGFTQKEFARMCGITESAMCRYLKDEREPKIDILANMATALNTTVEYLVSGKEEPSGFEDIYRLVARSTVKMSDAEKIRLVTLLMEK